jgi:hypothetical protein
MTDSLFGRQLYAYMQRQINRLIQGQEDTPTALLMEAMAREAPLRTMLMTSDGSISREMLDALLFILNGKFFVGARALLRAMRSR